MKDNRDFVLGALQFVGGIPKSCSDLRGAGGRSYLTKRCKDDGYARITNAEHISIKINLPKLKILPF